MLRRLSPLELGWVGFALANLVAMVAWPSWETVPFHFIWISLTLLYGFRVWRSGSTALVLGAVIVATGVSIFLDAFNGVQLWGELFEVPLMSAMFLAMVWHARRRQEALRVAEQRAEQERSLLERQERFLHDASHELRTPVTIARGHLELLSRLDRDSAPEVAVALDELEHIEAIVDRLLLLAGADQPDFILAADVDLQPFLEDVFLRWSDVAPRAWRLGPLVSGTLRADPERLRAALDALLENAVKYTQAGDAIELRARSGGGGVVIEVDDEGCGIPEHALTHIFDRFARADAARNRADGGVGLGLSIVDAVAKAHGGRCTIPVFEGGTTFALTLPGFTPRRGSSSLVPAASALRSAPSYEAAAPGDGGLAR